MGSLTFRAATAADLDALVALVTSAYRGDVSKQGWTSEADFLDGNRIDRDVLARDLVRPRSRVLVAERDGVMLACAHVCEERVAAPRFFERHAIDPGAERSGCLPHLHLASSVL